MQKACGFMGHQWYNVPVIRKQLYYTVKDLILNHNVTIFYTTRYKNFDKESYSICRLLKKEFSYIQIIYVKLRYDPIKNKQIIDKHGNITQEEANWYYLEKLNYDSVIIPELKSKGKHRIFERNEKIVDMCDYMICYTNNIYGNTQKIKNYANKKGVQIIELFSD